jgi:O-antigen/teichoic acid export membrane protein
LYQITSILRQKLFKNVFIFTSSNVVRSAIPFLLLPILTRYLTPNDYGIVATFQVLLSFAIVFINLNMHGAVAINYYKIEKEDLRIYIGNVISIIFISFLITFFLILFLKNPLSHIIKFPENWMPIIIVVAFFQSFFTIALTLWQAKQKALSYGLFQIAQTAMNVSISLILIVTYGWQWQGRVLGVVSASIIFGFISILILYHKKAFKFSINKSYIKDALIFGIPLVPHSMGTWIITSIDKVFINSMVDVASTGIYTVGYQVGMIIGLLSTSFNKAWAPFLFEKLKENNFSTKLRIVKFTYLYALCINLMALALSLIAPAFLKIFVSNDFHLSYKYVFWISLGYAANGMYYMVVNYIFYVKKTYVLAWITFLSAGINIVLNFFFIKANGAIGAAQATTVTFLISFILTWILSAKVYNMPWLLRRQG